jgi:hypothetical protein
MSVPTFSYNQLQVKDFNTMIFKSFAKNTNIKVDDVNKYKKPDGKISLPKSEITVAPEWEPAGVKALEKTTLKSIFETQKPYVEIAQLTIGNIAKIEDIIARIMPLLSASPLTAKSKKPVANPNAMGYKNGAELKSAISKMKSSNSKDGQTTVSASGEAIRQKPTSTKPSNSSGTQSDASQKGSTDNGNTSETQGKNWKVISTVYSTGEFIPSINYDYKYIDLPADTDIPDIDGGLDLSMDDPFDKYKPKVIILGIFDSKGVPLQPLSKLQAFTTTQNGTNPVTTNFEKAEWILESPKWKFPFSRNNQSASSQWPVYGAPFYIWKRYPGETRESKTKPGSSEGQPDWEIKTYEEGDKNIINGRDAIPGAPRITRFETSEETEYRNFFNDIATARMAKADGLTEQEKTESKNEILAQVDVRSHLENVFLYGQAKSSIYNRLPIAGLNTNNPFPDELKKSFKPYRIFSPEAANDPDLKKIFGANAGQVWIDPESDYYTKVIRVDPTTKIEYKQAGGVKTTTSAEIKAFVKNALNIRMSDDRRFGIEIRKSIDESSQPFLAYDTVLNTNNYYLENWNYNDGDGLLASDIRVNADKVSTFANNPPVASNTNSYKITIWGASSSPRYENLNYISWKRAGDFVELEKVNNEWTYNSFGFNFDLNNDFAFTKLKDKLEVTGGVEIDQLYNNFKANSSAKYSFNFTPIIDVDKNDKGHIGDSLLRKPYGSTQSAYITIKKSVESSSGTSSIPNLQYMFKNAKSFVLKAGKPGVTGQQPEYTFTITQGAIFENGINKIFVQDSPFSVSVNSTFYIKSISYEVSLNTLFSKKVITPTTGNVRLEEDGSIVEVVNNRITKWYYMTPSDLPVLNGAENYKNGDFKPSNPVAVTTETTLSQNQASGLYTNSPLPPNGNLRTLSIHLVRQSQGLITTGTSPKRPIIRLSGQTINSFQIRVQNNDGSSAIIDPSQITNDQLKTDRPFSTGKYGHGSSSDPQEIEVIKRFMKTEFDTESYYIIEGVSPDLAGGASASTAGSNAQGAGDSGDGDGNYYRLPDAIGAIKVFVMLLVDIFSKLIPNIKKLIKLFTNPPSFLTEIITEKVEENFTFLGKQAQAVFKQAAEMKKKIPKVNSRKAPTVSKPGAPGTPGVPPVPGAPSTPSTPNVDPGLTDAATSPSVSVDQKQLSPAIPSTSDSANLIKKQVSTLKELIKKSPLSNYVYVADDGKLVSVLDGTGTLEFDVFGNDLPAPVTGMGLPKLKLPLPFGIEFKMGNLPQKSPLKLVFGNNIGKDDLKNINEKLSGDDNTPNQQVPITSTNPNTNANQPNLGTQPNLNLSQQNGNANKDLTSIKFEDGSTLFLKNNLANDFIKQNSSKYNFVYVNQDIADKIRQADQLLERGSPEDVNKAKELLDSAAKNDPNNKAIQDKLDAAAKQQEKMAMGQHPLLKLLLGLVTTPVKMIAGIIEYIMGFFKLLTNPMKLPSAMIQFLSFTWIIDLLKPTALLGLMGVKFAPEKLPEWAALSAIPDPSNNTAAPSLNLPPDMKQKGFNPKKAGLGGFALPDDFVVADISEFFKTPFTVKLPKLTAMQYRQNPFQYLRTFLPTLCLIEKIINGIIDFIWSTLGIEVIIPPPHIKLCKDLDDSIDKNQPTTSGDARNAAQELSAFDPAKANDLFSGNNNADLSAFIYEVKMPSGEIKTFLNRQELDAFIEKNKDIQYQFNFS